MRVAHIESGRHLYGGARQVLYLIDGLRGEGVDNVLICPRGSAIAAEARALCRVVELPLYGDLDIGAPMRLRAALESVAPDIVHVHSRRGADLFAGFASIGAPWRTVLTRRVDHREWPPWARMKYSRYDALIAISSAIEFELVEHVGVQRARVHRVPSGVPVDRGGASSRVGADDARAAARRELGASLALPHDARIAGVVAQLIPRKGHGVLLRALAEALARHPQWHVVLLGRGRLEPTIRREVARLGLASRVHLAGFRPEAARWLPGLDLLLHPALKEGLGLAVLEAMAAAVPVAVSGVGGLVDIVEDGTSGVLVPPGDVRAWAAAADRLMRDGELRTRLAQGGLERVRAVFGVRRMVLGNLAVYREVTERAAATRCAKAHNPDRRTRHPEVRA
ncbi:MAG: glycosyltransferase [Gammaproteobacteria bacterium]